MTFLRISGTILGTYSFNWSLRPAVLTSLSPSRSRAPDQKAPPLMQQIPVKASTVTNIILDSKSGNIQTCVPLNVGVETIM